jgi:glyoxylase-like metal-dependent hydrolase (beta-lactamase superfamily II)
MREVADGVYHVPVMRGFVNAYIIDHGSTVTVVDAGLPGRARELLTAVASISRRRRRGVETIVVTHHHVDHIGALAALQKATGARVVTSRSEAEIVTGEVAAPPLLATSLKWRVLLAASERLGPSRAAPAKVNRIVADGDDVEAAGLRVVATPGHTAGHLSFVHDASGTLFVGDAAALSLRGNLTLPVGDHDEDPLATVASIQRLAELDVATACFGHGGVLRGGARARLGEFAERLAGS